MAKEADKSGVQGEGDYDAARRFDQDEENFVKSGKVRPKAREAEQALDGPEGEAIERARIETVKGQVSRKG